MKTTKREKQVIEVEVPGDIICDKCGQKIVTKPFDSFDCFFMHKTGQNFPEGGRCEKEEMDLCQKCAPALIELLKENGYTINTSEWDW